MQRALPYEHTAWYLTPATPHAQPGSYFSSPRSKQKISPLNLLRKIKGTHVRPPGLASRAAPGQGAEGSCKGLPHPNLGALGHGTSHLEPPS